MFVRLQDKQRKIVSPSHKYSTFQAFDETSFKFHLNFLRSDVNFVFTQKLDSPKLLLLPLSYCGKLYEL